MKFINFLLSMIIGFLSVIFASLIGIVSMFKPVGTIVLILVLFTSCGGNDNVDPTINSDDGFTYKIEVIDGCEYIYHDGYKKYGIAHKGNCCNPIHEHNY